MFFNGTFKGEQVPTMVGASYSDIISTLEGNAAKLNSNISFSDPKIKIDQTDPWNVHIQLNTRMRLSDSGKSRFLEENPYPRLRPGSHFRINLHRKHQRAL
jgi:hypothetical protein